MYAIYELDGTLITKTEHPCFELYNPVVQSFYVATEETGRAILVYPNGQESEGEEEVISYHANIEGREPFSWLEKTVRVVEETEEDNGIS